MKFFLYECLSSRIKVSRDITFCLRFREITKHWSSFKVQEPVWGPKGRVKFAKIFRLANTVMRWQKHCLVLRKKDGVDAALKQLWQLDFFLPTLPTCPASIDILCWGWKYIRLAKTPTIFWDFERKLVFQNLLCNGCMIDSRAFRSTWRSTLDAWAP